MTQDQLDARLRAVSAASVQRQTGLPQCSQCGARFRAKATARYCTAACRTRANYERERREHKEARGQQHRLVNSAATRA